MHIYNKAKSGGIANLDVVWHVGTGRQEQAGGAMRMGWLGGEYNKHYGRAGTLHHDMHTNTHTHKHPRLVVDVERGVVINAAEV